MPAAPCFYLIDLVFNLPALRSLGVVALALIDRAGLRMRGNWLS
jgi:hypothetical protein